METCYLNTSCNSRNGNTSFVSKFETCEFEICKGALKTTKINAFSQVKEKNTKQKKTGEEFSAV